MGAVAQQILESRDWELKDVMKAKQHFIRYCAAGTNSAKDCWGDLNRSAQDCGSFKVQPSQQHVDEETPIDVGMVDCVDLPAQLVRVGKPAVIHINFRLITSRGPQLPSAGLFRYQK